MFAAEVFNCGNVADAGDVVSATKKFPVPAKTESSGKTTETLHEAAADERGARRRNGEIGKSVSESL